MPDASASASRDVGFGPRGYAVSAMSLAETNRNSHLRRKLNDSYGALRNCWVAISWCRELATCQGALPDQNSTPT